MIYRLFLGYSATLSIYSSIVPTCSWVFHSFYVHFPKYAFGYFSNNPANCLALRFRGPRKIKIFGVPFRPQENTLLLYLLKLFLYKICKSANFVVPLQPNPTLEGNMSCEKRFAKALSWVGFDIFK